MSNEVKPITYIINDLKTPKPKNNKFNEVDVQYSKFFKQNISKTF